MTRGTSGARRGGGPRAAEGPADEQGRGGSDGDGRRSPRPDRQGRVRRSARARRGPREECSEAPDLQEVRRRTEKLMPRQRRKRSRCRLERFTRRRPGVALPRLPGVVCLPLAAVARAGVLVPALPLLLATAGAGEFALLVRGVLVPAARRGPAMTTAVAPRITPKAARNRVQVPEGQHRAGGPHGSGEGETHPPAAPRRPGVGRPVVPHRPVLRHRASIRHAPPTVKKRLRSAHEWQQNASQPLAKRDFGPYRQACGSTVSRHQCPVPQHSTARPHWSGKCA